MFLGGWGFEGSLTLQGLEAWTLDGVLGSKAWEPLRLYHAFECQLHARMLASTPKTTLKP